MYILNLIGMLRGVDEGKAQDMVKDRRSSSSLRAATWPMEWRISLCHLARNEKVKIWKISLKLLGTKSLGLISSGVTAINFSFARTGASNTVRLDGPESNLGNHQWDFLERKFKQCLTYNGGVFICRNVIANLMAWNYSAHDGLRNNRFLQQDENGQHQSDYCLNQHHHIVENYSRQALDTMTSCLNEWQSITGSELVHHLAFI